MYSKIATVLTALPSYHLQITFNSFYIDFSLSFPFHLSTLLNILLFVMFSVPTAVPHAPTGRRGAAAPTRARRSPTAAPRGVLHVTPGHRLYKVG